MSSFTGFGDGAVEFYDGLLVDNSKAYWTDQREVYEAHVRAPDAGAAGRSGGRVRPGQGVPSLPGPAVLQRQDPVQDALRGHRRPVLRAGRRGRVDGRGAGITRWRRTRSAGSAPPWTTSAGVPTWRSGWPRSRPTGSRSPARRLKTRPRGVDAEHPRLELMRHKSLYGWRRWPPDDVLHEAGAVQRVASAWRSLRPLTEWLDDHVGPSEHRGADGACMPARPYRFRPGSRLASREPTHQDRLHHRSRHRDPGPDPRARRRPG